MTTRIGIIGCGDIARKAYIPGLADYPNLQLIALADMDEARARALAADHGIPHAGSVEFLLALKEVELVINLTIPRAHAEIDRRILESGKHAYSEKPLATSLEEAQPIVEIANQRGLRLGCAPDTVLGAGTQGARLAIDQGHIGRPLSFTAFMAGAGHESWHPDPAFYYDHGGGPLYDMGPYYLSSLITLLGPVAAVTAFTSRGWDEREITSQPKAGQRCPVHVDTQINACLQMVNGAVGSLIMSFDTWRHHLPKIEIHGSEGSIAVSDPNSFAGPVLLNTRSSKEWTEAPLPHPVGRRGLGVAEMVAAIHEQRPHRCHADLALHVQDVMDAILRSGSLGGAPQQLRSRCAQPAAMPIKPPWIVSTP